MPAHSDPSPVAACLVREFARVLPDAGQARLARYADAVVATTRQGDLRRALACAAWAVELSGGGGTGLHRMAARLEEGGALAREAAFGAHYGLAVPDGVGPWRTPRWSWWRRPWPRR